MAGEAKFLRGPLSRVYYPALATARPSQVEAGQPPKPPTYGSTLIFDERSRGEGNGGGLRPVNAEREKKMYATHMPPLITAIGLMAREHWPRDFVASGAPWFDNQAWKSPWIDGGLPKWAGRGGLGAGTRFIRPTSNRPIPIADRLGQPISDPNLIYPGCYVYPLLTVFFYLTRPLKPNYGISIGLRGLQFAEDGERLDDAVNMSDYFEALEGDEMSPEATEASLAAMFKV
jgi:hypothetical protein